MDFILRRRFGAVPVALPVEDPHDCLTGWRKTIGDVGQRRGIVSFEVCSTSCSLFNATLQLSFIDAQ